MRTAYEIAQRRVKKKKEFYQHLTSFATVGAFLMAINAATSFGTWWFYFPMLGWSIGLIIHYFTVFGIPGLPKYDEEWEQRAIQQEVERKEQLFNVKIDKKEYKRIREKIKNKAGFFHHLGAYLAVGFFLVALNMATAFGNWWFQFPMLGWGIGLAIHYLTVFGFAGIGDYSEKWEERAIQQEMERLQGKAPAEVPKSDVESDLELRELEKEVVERKKWDDSQLV